MVVREVSERFDDFCVDGNGDSRMAELGKAPAQYVGSASVEHEPRVPIPAGVGHPNRPLM
ncbi:hypothetical protein A4X16_07315 [Microbacterium sp. H83]|nr:hypothetical protein A4X16_07315 [Microbacterium sp. H83]